GQARVMPARVNQNLASGDARTMRGQGRSDSEASNHDASGGDAPWIVVRLGRREGSAGSGRACRALGQDRAPVGVETDERDRIPRGARDETPHQVDVATALPWARTH